MDENKSLTDKYRKIDIDEVEVLPEVEPEKPKKEKKAKKEKAPKEKKVKEPKQPKEKKEKTPKEKKIKEPKPPKEKTVKEPKPEKIKEPKPPKEKKIKEPKPEKVKEPKVKKEKETKAQKEKKSFFGKKKAENEVELAEELTPEILVTSYEVKAEYLVKKKEESQDISQEQMREENEIPVTPASFVRVEEEIVLPVVTRVKKVKPTKKEKQPKEKKVKESKTPKEKKVKEPKPPKEKKVKEPKPPKAKKEKAPKEPKEKKPREPMNKKDFATIGIAVVAVALACTFAYFRFFHDDNPQIGNTTEPSTEAVVEKLSDIQIARNGVIVNLVQTDIPDVFYGITTDYKVKYYQYRDNKMVAVKSTGSVSTEVDFGNESLPVTIDYVTLGGKIYGIGLFVANEGEEIYFYNMMVFKLTNLPAEYAEEGKALLLATTSRNALTQGDILWPESFTIDLESGKTSRFLKIVNRSIDIKTGAGVTDFCILTQQGYNSTTSQVPFITAREYEQGSGMLDIFVKDGTKESLFAENIYGKFLLTDGDSVLFMRKTNTGFDVIRKTGETEETVRSFYGSMGTDYLHKNEYLLNVNDGNLYNMLTGEKKMLVGFRMDPEMMAISDDGKYVVMLGTVKNMMDYQVHIFNLESGEYAKFEDQNYSSHSNLTFINNTTAVYTILDPNQGYEYVVMDVSKIK